MNDDTDLQKKKFKNFHYWSSSPLLLTYPIPHSEYRVIQE
jgi:hypothetical protein